MIAGYSEEHPDTTLLEHRPSTWEAGSSVKRLDEVTSATAGGRAFKPEEHEDCPGHAAFVDVYRAWSGDDRSAEGRGPRAWYCTAWKTSGHFNRHRVVVVGGDIGADDRRAEGRAMYLVETNKAADAAEVVRRAWITEFLGRDKMPADAIAYVEQMLTLGYRTDLNEPLAVSSPRRRSAPRADRALHLVALAIAHAEQHMPHMTTGATCTTTSSARPPT